MAEIQGTQKICIASGKGGVGKTSISVNLAFALAQKEQRVLVVDGDLGLANVDVLLGLSVEKTIRDVLEGGADPLESIIYVKQNLGILPASSGVQEMVTLGLDAQEQLTEFLAALSNNFDYILMDTAAGIGQSVIWFNKLANSNIIVITPDPASITDAYALIKILSKDYDMEEFHIVLNRITSTQQAEQAFNTMANAAKKFLNLELSFLGSIAEDKTVPNAVRNQSPFILQSADCEASKGIFTLAENIQTYRRGIV
jgi:flagellar biosynthesis protein FlhG